MQWLAHGLPIRTVERRTAGRWTADLTDGGMSNRSSRQMEDLAEGLIVGCADHFGESVSIATRRSDDGSVAFRITRAHASSAGASVLAAAAATS